MALFRVLRPALALSLLIATVWSDPALAACDGAVYRVEMASEAGDSWSLRLCGREGFSLLAWAGLEPSDRSDREPEGDLGPRFVLVVERLRGGTGHAIVRQDFYPLADFPAVFAAPGQIFSHPLFGGIYTVPAGWRGVVFGGVGTVPDRLRELGAPIPERSLPTLTPPPQPSSETTTMPTGNPAASGSGADGPDLVTLLAVGALAAVVALLVIRRRSGS